MGNFCPLYLREMNEMKIHLLYIDGRNKSSMINHEQQSTESARLNSQQWKNLQQIHVPQIE